MKPASTESYRREPPEEMHAVEWRRPPENVTLGSSDVHVWRASLEAAEPRIEGLWRILSADERDRASRFHFRRDRAQFIVARGTLRVLLGRYRRMDPARLGFAYGPKGKPFLADQSAEKALRFNVSHSGRLALYAFALGREVGVDVEFLRASFSDERIPEQFFSSREAAAIRRLPSNLQPQAFLACWTRKESYLKAQGAGLGDPWDDLDASQIPGEFPSLLSCAENLQHVSRWSVRSLHPRPGYAAALTVEGHGLQLKCWDWPENQVGQSADPDVCPGLDAAASRASLEGRAVPGGLK